MTTTIRTVTSAVSDIGADAVVIAISEGQDGPVLAAGAQRVDEALGGSLLQTLTALGATGKPEEVTKLVSGGRLAAPLVAAVGIGRAGHAQADLELLRRAAGAAVRSLASASVRKIAIALPAADAGWSGTW